ncbi:hypothetical protein Tco_0494747 [Tanacetum coccineum]
MAEIGCNWARIGPSKSSQSLSIILLGFPGPSDGLRLHPIVFFSSGSGLTADSSVLTLTLTFLDFGLDFAQSFPFHAQFCHFGLVFCLFDDIYFLHNTNAKQTYIWQFLSVFGHLSSFLEAQEYKIKSHDLIIQQMKEDLQAMRVGRIPGPMKGPVYVGEHCGLRLPTEAYDEESILEEQMLNLMHRFADRFTRRRP